ncbi:MAG: DNA-binding response regulator [Acidobacteria bacterium]|nr:MAG: DNA-binding response regulator [Acidobacteriota bacterium]
MTDQPANRILVVDDEPSITDLVSTALKFVGFGVATAGNGRDALAMLQRFEPDLVILDVMLPDVDGFELCSRMRASGEQVPVIFLTARDEDDDKISGLEQGGDDYVTKPFSLEELVARVRAVLRRSGKVEPDQPERLSCGDLVIDTATHRVLRGGAEIELSPTEFRLLRFLMINSGKVVSKSEILDHVWQYDFGGNANVVETYISYLRRKVDQGKPKLIQTVRGFGYSLRPET